MGTEVFQMRLEGVDCHEAKHLGFRDSDPSKDFDIDGRPVGTSYVSIVRIKDCDLYTENGQDF